jgi:ATP-dependent protease ClpP protease subunit
MLFKTLAMNSSKSFEDILERSRRDMWFNSDEALDYGFIDEIIGLDKSPSITTLMEGYDEYYQREVLGRK